MAGEIENGAVITAREIYDGVMDVRSRVDVLIGGTEATRVQVNDHEDRIRGLERWRYTLPISAVVAAGSAAATIAAVIFK